jgi:hypothetical protein
MKMELDYEQLEIKTLSLQGKEIEIMNVLEIGDIVKASKIIWNYRYEEEGEEFKELLNIKDEYLYLKVEKVRWGKEQGEGEIIGKCLGGHFKKNIGEELGISLEYLLASDVVIFRKKKN